MVLFDYIELFKITIKLGQDTETDSAIVDHLQNVLPFRHPLNDRLK